ncbi:MAG: PaaI family thioesterase [Geminicoccaceae bacterium]|nr:PaaI family thioesterase [Geminicoccaceae bacterium]MDW8368744.1 PaaI family thioesterase [Geminicoccaceae bacterium]
MSGDLATPPAAGAPLDAAALEALFLVSPYIAGLGVRVEAVDAAAGRVVASLALRPELERAAGSGQFHGGAIAALIDIAGDMAVALGLGGGVPTIDLRVDYLRPALGDRLRATATLKKLGRTVALADVEVVDAQGRLCAVGRGCHAARVG